MHGRIDVGGIEAYKEFLTVIANTSHADHHEQAEWVTEMTGQLAGAFDPTEFDADATNRELRKHFPANKTRAQ